MDLTNTSDSETLDFSMSNYSELGLDNAQHPLVVFPRYSSLPIQIPLTSLSSSHEDPRFQNEVWRDNIYMIKKNDLNSYGIPSLKVKKLNIIIDLESMIYMIHPKVSHNSDSIEKEIKRLGGRYRPFFKPIYFSAGHVYYIIALRPNLDSFLRNLNQKATLHLITSVSDNYLHDIVRAIDPHWNHFRGNIHHSKNKERSLLELGFDPSDTLIIDSNIENWSIEDQGNIIPSMKFIPCPKEHSEYENSSKYQERVKSYSYFKGLIVVDEKIPFIDKDDQLPIILKIVRNIHRYRFLSCYTKGVSEIYEKLKKRVLQGKSIFFLYEDEEVNNAKIESYKAIVESLGGIIINSSCAADIIISEETISCDPSKFKTPQWLIPKFFNLN